MRRFALSATVILFLGASAKAAVAADDTCVAHAK